MSPQVYELRVRGTVPESILDEIGAHDMGEEPSLTILRTEPTDQAGLHGLLQRMRSLGLDLVEVRTTPVADEIPAPRRPARPTGRLRAAGKAPAAGEGTGTAEAPGTGEVSRP